MRPGTRKVVFGGRLGPKGRCKAFEAHGCDVQFMPYRCQVTAPALQTLTMAAEISTAMINGQVYEIVGAPVITDDTVTVTGQRTKD